MLTNFKTIKLSVDKLKKIELMSTDGTFDNLPKKEVISLTRELVRLEKNLSGVKDMRKVPKAIFLIDPKREIIAINEARKLKIPIVALVDTNCDPDNIDYVIPANDDSSKSINFFVERIANACMNGIIQRKKNIAKKKAIEEKKISYNKFGKKNFFETQPLGNKAPEIEIIHAKQKRKVK